MTEIISISSRFCGPPESGNGGYVCGIMAATLSGTVEVTLQQPPPLHRDLQLTQPKNNFLQLFDNDTVIATARNIEFQLDIPAPPTFLNAKKAESHYQGFERHNYPCCFVCGPERGAEDGLRIFASPLENSNLVASAWIPDASLNGDDGLTNTEFLWAALDCPGYFAFQFDDNRPALLGRMSAHTKKGIKAGDHCVVIGWEIDREGRKYLSGTALFGPDNQLYGYAQATWITLKK